MKRILINTLITIILVFLLEIVLVDPFPQIHQFVGEIPTYTGVKNAKQQINNTLNSIESTTRQIEELVKLAESSQTITIQKKYTKDDVDWQLNIPQLLIYLDKGAEECNVDIDIHYNLANMYNQPGEYANAINETAPSATETTETAETAEAINLTAPLNLISESGFKVYVLPVSVYGSFESTKNFIQYCTQTSFIIPYSIGVNYDETTDKIKTDIVFKILYVE